MRKKINADLTAIFVNNNGDIMEQEWKLKHMQSSDLIIAVSKDVHNQERINAANTELEKSIALEKMKLEFFAQISHEFKTPLNIILSSIQLLKVRLKNTSGLLFDSEYDRFFNYIEQNSYKLLRLAQNLIDLTRASNEFLDLSLENYDLQNLLYELIKSVEPYASARGVSLSFRSGIKETPYIFCDRDKIERIVLNLLANSLKNMNSGGTIEVLLTSNKNFMKIAIIDTGIGIRPEVLPFIFDKFRVSETGFTRHCEGSGIGLSIVKSLVHAHKGTIKAKSVVGKGSKFEFTISKSLNISPAQNQVLKNGGYLESRTSRILMEMSSLQ